jgi:hypothetical protein
MRSHAFPRVIARKRQDGIRTQITWKNRPRYRYADNAIQPWNAGKHTGSLCLPELGRRSRHMTTEPAAIFPDDDLGGRAVRILGQYHTLRSGAAEAHGFTSASMALWFLDAPNRMGIVCGAGRDIHASPLPRPRSVAAPSNPDTVSSAGHPRSGHHHHGGPAWSSE